MAEHPDIVVAAKRIYELRLATAWGRGLAKRPNWDDMPQSFRDEIVAEVKAAARILLSTRITDAMRTAAGEYRSYVRTLDETYRDMVGERLKELGVER